MRQQRLSRPVPAAAMLALLALAGGAAAQTLPLDIEVGYRWATISGTLQVG